MTDEAQYLCTRACFGLLVAAARLDVVCCRCGADLREAVGQGLQDSRHEHPTHDLVEDRVTDADQTDDERCTEDRHDVAWHALPEVQQETLHLQHMQGYSIRSA